MTAPVAGARELPTGGLLGVFAHPDDETLGAGGLLATAARAGLGVTVVTGNRGERGEVIPPDLAHLEGDGPALAAHREGELAQALTALGVTGHRFLDALPGLDRRRPQRFTDSGMAWLRPGLAGPVPDAGPDAFTAVDVDITGRLLAGLIRRTRPAVVVTEEPGGGYGHPDHVQAHRVTMRAVELAADAPALTEEDGTSSEGDPLAGLEPWSPAAVAWVVRGEPEMRSALRWLDEQLGAAPQRGERGNELIPMPAEGELPTMVVPAEQVDLTVDTTAVLGAVAEAMRAHRSQVQGVRLVDDAGNLADDAGTDSRARSITPPAHGWFAVSNDIAQPLLGTATLRIAPGYGSAEALAAALRVAA